MGKGWFGVVVVCGLGGCGDDEPSWLPPSEDAGALTTAVEAVDTSVTRVTSSTNSLASSSTTGSPTQTDVGTPSSVGTTREGSDGASDAARLGPESSSNGESALIDAGLDVSDSSASDAAPTDVSSTTVVEPDGGVPSDPLLPDASGVTYETNTDVTLADSGLSATDESSSGVSDEAFDGGYPDGGYPDGGFEVPVEARAGFIDVEAVDYVEQESALRTSSARLFYAFSPADDLPEEAPVFVFFNGGPGSATSSGLLSYGTGPFSLPADLSGPNLSPNPWSWTRMGNILYFDTRQAGFSYSTLPEPENDSARAAEWVERNFNMNVDAADSVRLLLRVLTSQPALRDNPIILVGESYGGTRATMMLRFLLNPESIRTTGPFQDPALAEEITNFFEANLVEGEDDVSEQAKRQLPAQVLIQPFFAGNQFADQDDIRCLPDSPAQQVATEVSAVCEDIRLYRDPYKIDEPVDWSSTIDELAQQTLMHPTKLPTLLGVDLSSISGRAAAERTLAYRDPLVGSYAAPAPEFLTALGALQPWDAYHLTITPRDPWDENLYYDPTPCAYFSWVAQYVDTLITNAKWDNVVLTNVLPTTLYDCSQLFSTPFVDSVAFAQEGLGLGDSGQMVVQYNDAALVGASEVAVEIRGYEAGHMVTVTHAEPFFNDVQAFLVARGVL